MVETLFWSDRLLAWSPQNGETKYYGNYLNNPGQGKCLSFFNVSFWSDLLIPYILNGSPPFFLLDRPKFSADINHDLTLRFQTQFESRHWSCLHTPAFSRYLLLSSAPYKELLFQPHLFTQNYNGPIQATKVESSFKYLGEQSVWKCRAKPFLTVLEWMVSSKCLDAYKFLERLTFQNLTLSI